MPLSPCYRTPPPFLIHFNNTNNGVFWPRFSRPVGSESTMRHSMASPFRYRDAMARRLGVAVSRIGKRPAGRPQAPLFLAWNFIHKARPSCLHKIFHFFPSRLKSRNSLHSFFFEHSLELHSFARCIDCSRSFRKPVFHKLQCKNCSGSAITFHHTQNSKCLPT